MIKREILDKLTPITDEELAILGGESVDKSIYTVEDGSVVSQKSCYPMKGLSA